MTIATATNRRATYTGNGATTAFAFSFKIFDETDLVVTTRNTTTGVLTTKTITTHYTVSGTGNTTGSTNYTSGNVNFLSAPDSSTQVIITCSTPIKQEVDLTEHGAFPSATIEEMADRLTVISNEVRELASRGVSIDAVNASTVSTALTGVPSAGQIVGVNDAGTGLAFLDPTAAVADLGTMSQQNASSVTITGGSVTGITDITVADGGTGRSTATAYAVICGGTTSTGAHQSIASVGTSGQVLTSNGAGALPTFQTPAGGGGMWSYVSSVTGSTSNISFTGLTASTMYKLAFNRLSVSSSGYLRLTLSTDNGSTYLSTNEYSWNIHGIDNGVAKVAYDNADDYIAITYPSAGYELPTAASNKALVGELVINTEGPVYTVMQYTTYDAGNHLIGATSYGRLVTGTTDINALRLTVSSGGNLEGTVHLYQLVTS